MHNARSLKLDQAKVGTSGAYLMVDDYYAFAVGPKHSGDTLAVIRLGGHCEKKETAWQCATRELNEEAQVNISPLAPQTTYWVDRDSNDTVLQKIVWPLDMPGAATPLLVASDNRTHDHQISVMYLAYAKNLPTPSSEVKGLLLLRPSDVIKIVDDTITLAQYIDNGGKTILTDIFDETKILEPFFQLRALSTILKLNNGHSLQK